MIVIVIPTYNERENVVKLITRIEKQYSKLGSRLMLLIADDNSPDGTKETVLQFIASQKPSLRVEVLTKTKKTGLKDAYFNAFKYLLKKYPGITGVIQMDADLSHDPKYLKLHIRNLEDGCDLSIGSRYISGGGISNWGWSRVAMSKIGNSLNRIILSPRIRDYTGGFNGISAPALRFATKRGVVTSSGYYFLTEMKYRVLQKHFKVSEFPIIFTDRVLGDSKMGGSIVIESIKQLLRIRFTK